MKKFKLGTYAIGLISAGVLFFVIGYSLEKGKDYTWKKTTDE